MLFTPYIFLLVPHNFNTPKYPHHAPTHIHSHRHLRTVVTLVVHFVSIVIVPPPPPNATTTSLLVLPPPQHTTIMPSIFIAQPLSPLCFHHYITFRLCRLNHHRVAAIAHHQNQKGITFMLCNLGVVIVEICVCVLCVVSWIGKFLV